MPQDRASAGWTDALRSPRRTASVPDRPAAYDLNGPGDWARLTATAGKDAVFAADLWMREAWARMEHALGEEGAYTFAADVALAWLRPDAFAAGCVRRVLAAAEQAGFRPLAACPVWLGPAGVRALWGYMCRWATVERLWLLDGVAALGPGLLVLYADGPAPDTGSPGPEAAARRLSRLKGANVPGRRAAGTLRAVAGSPNRVLSLVHTADEPADVIRELGILCPPEQLPGLVRYAADRLDGGRATRLAPLVRQVEQRLPVLGPPASLPPHAVPAGPESFFHGPLERRWEALCAAAAHWPLLAPSPGPPSWPEQAERSPWR